MKINLFLLLISCITPVGLIAQNPTVTLSGTAKDKASAEALSFATVGIKQASDSSFVSGTISDDEGLFKLTDVKPGEYLIDLSLLGYARFTAPVFVGSRSEYLNLGVLLMEESSLTLDEVTITAEQASLSSQLDKKTYSLEDNLSQSGGSVLQSMQNLAGVTVQDGHVKLRGSNQVVILIDGKQTAITGMGSQNGLDNLPASVVDKIEIINNPSAKYDANGNAGIINIILKKENQDGFNARLGLTAGLGALWVRQENFPGIRPQYQRTPKINPSASLNFRKKDFNLFLQADNLYTETLNKNEFVTRTYDDGTIIKQQLKRNRNTNFFTSKAGTDWFINDQNSITVYGLFSQESIMDRGDQPFFNNELTNNLRLWQFLEDEVLTAVMGSAAYQHKFNEPGHELNLGVNYTFDREDEKYFFDNILPTYTGVDSFKLIADQRVADINLDYTRPLKHGLLETGVKFRRRTIPTNMEFFPGLNSPFDPDADGMATYQETIPAVYGNYIYETKKLEVELGLRVEYVGLTYEVDPNHNTYSSDGYDYFQPFPNTRITWNLNGRNKLSAFFNRRVDRPDEGDLRIFPKYDDAEIIKVGNPAISPQFTNSVELGYRNAWENGYYYAAAYHRNSDGTITRIATSVAGSSLIYNVSQNAGKSSNTGIEMTLDQRLSDRISININANGYRNQIDSFSVVNLYPVETLFTAEKQEILSGNIKMNMVFRFDQNLEAQLTGIYLAPDIIPQGTIDARYSLDFGIKKSIQQGKGDLFLNATDLLNTMVIRKTFSGDGFSYTSTDYYETQVIRVGYGYKF